MNSESRCPATVSRFHGTSGDAGSGGTGRPDPCIADSWIPAYLGLQRPDQGIIGEPGTEAGEQLVYLHYVGRATGPDGPVAFRGLDRVRTRNGVVFENVIRYDTTSLVVIVSGDDQE